jgi:Xaa-Pro aminopeptidase
MKPIEEHSSQELIEIMSPMNYPSRIKSVREKYNGIADGMLVTHLTNLKYLTGFTGSNGILLVQDTRLIFITDGRYAIAAKNQLEISQIDAVLEITSSTNKLFDILNRYLKNDLRICFESATLAHSGFEEYTTNLVSIELIPTIDLIEDIRKIKEKGEVDRIRIACRIADEALYSTFESLKSFPTEKEFATTLSRKMVDLGASGNSFDPIVACGKHGALPHAVPTGKNIEPNQLIVIDFGCVFEGYSSDMTRTLSVGEPDTEQRKMYESVSNAQTLGVENSKAGLDSKEIDSYCRKYLDDLGLGETFTHGTGHGVGLDVHENPRVAMTSTEVVQAGYVITIEPGIYFENIAGVRIEDTIHITGDGNEVLTQFKKFLVI